MKDFPRKPERPEWMDTAPCAQVDPDLWYPAPRVTHASATARRVCLGCEHRAPCLTYALENNEIEGMWGGKTPEQRRRMRREQGRAA